MRVTRYVVLQYRAYQWKGARCDAVRVKVCAHHIPELIWGGELAVWSRCSKAIISSSRRDIFNGYYEYYIDLSIIGWS